MITEIQYTPRVKSEECMQAVRQEGALLLRGFVNNEEQYEVYHEVLAHDLRPVDRSSSPVAEQFCDTGWKFRQSPPHVFSLGRRVCALVRPELPQWFINDIRAQVYQPGEAGIDWHKDYSRDLRLVAVASFKEPARFDIELESGPTSWELFSGDLVLIRGALLNSRVDDRPRHKIAPPQSGKRLSIAFRQVASEAPDLL